VAGRRDDGSGRCHLAVGFGGFPERALTCSESRDDGSGRCHLAVGFGGFPERALTCSEGPGRRPHQGPRTTNNRWCRLAVAARQWVKPKYRGVYRQ